MGDDDDDELENSRVVKKGSNGMDIHRKSVIQQQSEKYIMKKNKMPMFSGKHKASNKDE